MNIYFQARYFGMIEFNIKMVEDKAMHEHAPGHIAPVKGSSNRSFGLVFTVFFAVLGLMPFLHGYSMRLWPFLIAVTFLALSLVVPNMLAPLNRLWTKFGILLHGIVSPVALGIIFFMAVTPIGLLMRLFGKDSLNLKIDKTATTYWITRTPPGPAPESLKNQF